MSTEMKFHRPVVMGAGGMASTGHPLASSAALDVLRKGGNAVDAALAASGVLAVVKSYHGGLGGDLFGVFYSAQERKVFVLNGSGRSPLGLERDRYAHEIPERGILAACTPGAADAWVEAAAKLGSRSLGELLAPAVEYAENGFPMFPHLGGVIRSAQKTLGADPAWAEVFLPGGKAPEIGDLLIQKDLARTLAAIGSGGREAFYAGETAKSIVRASERRGGYFSAADFAEHRSRWEEALAINYRGRQVCVPPPNSYGLLLLLQLKILSDCDVAADAPDSPERVALQVSAKEQAWRAGEAWIADPGRRRREELSDFLEKFPGQAKPNGPAAAPGNPGSDTTYIATADKRGNWASLIQSVHQSFGCGIVAEGTGVLLNNRMSGFSLAPGHPNELAPGKLPAHTLSPALVLKDGRPVLAIGTPGGPGQTQFLAQTLCNIFDYGMNLQEAIEAPRWQSEAAGRVELEGRFPAGVGAALAAAGYGVKTRGPWEFAFGGVEAVGLCKNGKVFMGAADPRREGYAMGY